MLQQPEPPPELVVQRVCVIADNLESAASRRPLGSERADDDVPAQPLAKAVLIVRQSLDPASAYADVAIHADGHITLQWREKSGDPTKDLTATEHKSTTLRLERKGDVFTAYAQKPDGTLDPFASYTVPMTGEVYVGLGVCPHDAEGLATATFSNVKIEQPKP